MHKNKIKEVKDLYTVNYKSDEKKSRQIGSLCLWIGIINMVKCSCYPK